jgi:SSS family solute:Na+ symporter
MINFYDYLNIGFYFAFIIGVGIYFSRKSKNTSDYFRGGGALPWWVTGASAWMAGFTAWTFVGAAGKIYQTGPYVLVLYYQNVIPVIVLFALTCYRFRRMRVVTPMEALRLRFGPGAQQFYTWIRLPLMLVFGGFTLNSVAVFMSAVFGFPLETTLIALGLMVTFISLLGGAMGVVAADFVQMFLIVLVAGTAMVLALLHPAIGGFSGLMNQAPPAHFNWSEIARPEFISLWWVALTLNTLFSLNTLSDEKAAKYMMAQSDSHARRMILIPFLGTVFGPILWIIPPMAAAVLIRDLPARFPQLTNPEEAAFLAIAQDLLPQGMLGLLICCIFAASVTDIAGSLNWGSGLLLRNFYLPVINPQCPEKRLIKLSRFGVAGLGALIVGCALLINYYRTIAAAGGRGWGLFDLVNQVGTSLLMPMAIPACLGMFYRRTPPWSAWTTAVIGLLMSYVAIRYLQPQFVASLPGLAGPYTFEETRQFGVISTAFLVGGVCVAWFFFTSLFYEKTSPEHKANVNDLFDRMATPLPDHRGPEHEENHGFAISIGRMCMLYGGFITLLSLIPNSLQGRLCYIACGGVMLGLGLWLNRFYRRKQKIPV